MNDLRNDARNYFPKPDEDPWFPNDITTEDTGVLGKLMNLYTLWRNYATMEVAYLDSDLSLMKEKENLQEAIEMVKLIEDDDLRERYKNVADRKCYILQLSHVRIMQEDLSRLSAETKISKAVLSNFDERYACVSRELSRRQSEWQRN